MPDRLQTWPATGLREVMDFAVLLDIAYLEAVNFAHQVGSFDN